MSEYQQTGGQRELFSATCADCGRRCEVPFRPAAGKPVYCRECFAKRRGEGSPREPVRAPAQTGNAPRPQSGTPAKPQAAPPVQFAELKRELDVMNAKLDTLLQKFEGAGPKTRKPAGKKTDKKPRGGAKRKK